MPLCYYSNFPLSFRLPRVDEKLKIVKVSQEAWGFVPDEAPKRKVVKDPIWLRLVKAGPRLLDWARNPYDAHPIECTVDLPVGTRLIMHNIPQIMRNLHNIGESAVVIFDRTAADNPNAEGIRLPNSAAVLILTQLPPELRFTITHVPGLAVPKTISSICA